MHKLLLVALLALVATPSHAKVGVRTTTLGKVLVDARGHTLYVYDQASCTGACAANWPPFLTHGKPVAAGVPAAKLGVKKLAGGKLQVTFAGKALYFFAGDSRAGEVAGASIPHWAALSPAGAKLRPAPAPPTTITTTPPNYGGGGGGGY